MGEDRSLASVRLVTQLRMAHAGELAAGHAYAGHWRAARKPDDRERIRRIEEEEWRHRRAVGAMLARLGARPSMARELVFWVIGRVLGLACHVSGALLPMYGAGWLERRNVKEYEDAADFALAAGHGELVEELLVMAETEWDHERYFREQVQGHPRGRWLKVWAALPPRESIRARHRAQGEALVLPAPSRLP